MNEIPILITLETLKSNLRHDPLSRCPDIEGKDKIIEWVMEEIDSHIESVREIYKEKSNESNESNNHY